MESANAHFKTAIFDLDGTLLDTLPDLWYSTNYALTRFGWPERTLNEVRSFVGNGVKNLIKRAVPEGTGPEEEVRCLSVFKEHYAGHMSDHTSPYPGIPEALTALKASGIRLAVVSNKFDAAVRELCGKYFGGIIKTAIGEFPEVAKKPAPDSVFRAMEQLSAEPASTIYIGDSEVDIETAKNAGLPCLGVSWGFRGRTLLEEKHADYVVDTPDEMTEIICGSSVKKE